MGKVRLKKLLSLRSAWARQQPLTLKNKNKITGIVMPVIPNVGDRDSRLARF